MIWSCQETSMGTCGYRVVTLGVILVLIFTVNIHEVGASVAKTQLENTGVVTTQSQDIDAAATSGHGSSNSTTAHHRYHVFHFDFDNVEAAYVVSLWIFIASLAKIGFHLNNKLSSIFPESCLLIILGIIVGIIVYLALLYNGSPSSANPAQYSPQYSLNAKTFFQFLLPPIILDAGYFMPNRAFFNNIGTILLYAVIGTCWNAASIGLTLWGITSLGLTSSEIPLLHCLVFSSLISAVDPVAVLAVFEEIHVNEQLHIVVFGESLLNDAVTVVLYHMFMDYALQDQLIVIDIFAGILQFFVVGIGGVLIGVLFGLFCAFITKYTAHVRVIEPIFVFLLAYLAYLTAEMFHLSGIMALTFCGIVMKNYVVFNISEKSQTTIKYFLKMLSSMTETVIFMMLGTSAVKDNHVWDVVFIVVTIVACLVYRAIGTITLTWIANKYRVSKLKAVDQFVMAYGGLRGAIAFALAILIDDANFKDKDLFVTATILVVMFTVFVQGITIKPLVNALKVKKKQGGSSTMGEQIHVRLVDHMMAAVEDITGYRGNHTLRDKWEYYDNKYLKKFLLREKQMTKEHSIMRTHSKLSLKDAMHTMHSGFSTANMPANNGQSLLRLISNWSVNSFHDQENDLELRQRMSSQGGSEADVHHNDTVVDLQALDAHFSKKIADDTKTHHLLEENLIAPRAKLAGLKHHQRHTIHEDDVDESHHNSAYYHHNARLHLRHMISKHQHNLQERKKQKAQAKLDKNHRLPKNVSFANIASPNNQAGNGTHANIQGDDNSDDEMGIQFTAKSESDRDLNDVKELMSPVALECQLPWKRNACPQESEPVCSMATHLLPDDTTPELSQIPSWADNLDYNHIPAVSPRASTHTDAPNTNDQLNKSNNNSASRLDSDIEMVTISAPLVPTIQIDSPSSSSNNLLMKGTLCPPYLSSNISEETSPPKILKNGASPDVSSPSGTDSTQEVHSDEEVEIKPFGKVPMSSKFSNSKLAREHSPPPPSPGLSDNEESSSAGGSGSHVVFVLSQNDDAFDEEDV